jgi:hypothetical protein
MFCTIVVPEIVVTESVVAAQLRKWQHKPLKASLAAILAQMDTGVSFTETDHNLNALYDKKLVIKQS